MNKLKGIIVEVVEHEGISLIKVDVDGLVIESLIINPNDGNSIYVVDTCVELVFKETALVLSKVAQPSIGICNAFECVVTSIKKGQLMNQISLQYQQFELTSINSQKGLNRLSIEENDKVTALINSNEIMIVLC